MLWISPVDSFQHIGHLRRRDRNRAARHRGPDELSAVKALGVKRQADAIVPKNLGEIAPATSENEKIPAMRVAIQTRLPDGMGIKIAAPSMSPQSMPMTRSRRSEPARPSFPPGSRQHRT